MAQGGFSIDVAAIRERARGKMTDGPVADGYRRSAEEVIGVLNDVLATERRPSMALEMKAIGLGQRGFRTGEIGKPRRQRRFGEPIWQGLVELEPSQGAGVDGGKA